MLAKGKISLEWKLNEHHFLFFASLCISFKRAGLRGKGSNGFAASQSPSTSHVSSTTVKLDREGYGLISTSVSILSHPHETAKGRLSCIREENDLLAVRKEKRCAVLHDILVPLQFMVQADPQNRIKTHQPSLMLSANT